MQIHVQDKNAKIHTFQRPNCYLCGEAGEVVYTDLQDRLYHVSGEWSLRQCCNESCRLVWLDPSPIESDLIKVYSSYYTHQEITKSPAFLLRQRIKQGIAGLSYGYHSATDWFDKLLAVPFLFSPFLRENMIATGCGYLNGKTKGTLLEIGYGTGTTLANLRDLGWKVNGIDFDVKAAEAARLNFNINVISGSLVEANYTRNQFDAILMSHVIEHIFDPVIFLTECSRILKPGGRLVILTPNINSIGSKRFTRSWIHLDPPRHLYLFSKQTLCEVAAKAGLLPVKYKTTVRDNNLSWLMSMEISKSGKWENSTKPRFWRKIQAKTYQVYALIKLCKNSDSGDEIVLTFTK
jgi:SAM-dependent methyltransferase